MSTASHIQIGAFWRNSPGYFDDVIIPVTDPPVSFTTGLNSTFPSGMLNNTQPSGYPAGTGGTDAINRVIDLDIATIPQFEMPDNTLEGTGPNGEPLYVRRRNAPRAITMGLDIPDIGPTDANYARIWNDLKLIAFRGPYIWLLHDLWAAKAFISSAPNVFQGADVGESPLFTFKIKGMYYTTISGSTKTYSLLY